MWCGWCNRAFWLVFNSLQYELQTSQSQADTLYGNPPGALNSAYCATWSRDTTNLFPVISPPPCRETGGLGRTGHDKWGKEWCGLKSHSPLFLSFAIHFGKGGEQARIRAQWELEMERDGDRPYDVRFQFWGLPYMTSAYKGITQTVHKFCGQRWLSVRESNKRRISIVLVAEATRKGCLVRASNMRGRRQSPNEWIIFPSRTSSTLALLTSRTGLTQKRGFLMSVAKVPNTCSRCVFRLRSTTLTLEMKKLSF